MSAARPPEGAQPPSLAEGGGAVRAAGNPGGGYRKSAIAPELQPLLAVAAAIVDPDGLLVEANAGFRRLLPEASAAQPRPLVARFFIQPTFRWLLQAAQAGAAAGTHGYQGLFTLGDTAGVTRTLRGEARLAGAALSVVAEYDIEEIERTTRKVLELHQHAQLARHETAGANIVLRENEARIVEDSLTDALTGLGNRRKLDSVLAVEIARARRSGGGLCAIMVDIDHFKRINDDYGHAAGDKVLARLGELLRSQIRATDSAARFGGEEFFMLLPHTELAQAVVKAGLLRQALERERIDPLDRAVTASFGVAQLAPGEAGDALLAAADAALYRAKEGGRNRVVARGDPD